MKEVVTGDRVLKDLKVEDPIQADCREYRILCATKEELVPSCMFASYRPCRRSPQRQPVEMALISEN